MLRKLLVKIRQEYLERPQRLFLYGGLALVVLVALGALLDFLLPYLLWANILRCLVMVPLALVFFVLEYALALFLHDYQLTQSATWQPLRLRFSLRWRRRMALIASAFIVVFISATGFKVGYTAASALYVSLFVALSAFIRPTKQEITTEELDIPDARDIKFKHRLEAARAAREARLATPKEEK